MSDNKIKIGADIAEVKKSILEIGRHAKDLNKNKISLMTKEDREFLKTGAKQAIEGINSVINEQTKLYKKAVDERSKLVKGSEEEKKKQLEIVKILRERTNLERQIRDLQKVQSDIAPSMGDKTKGLLSKIPGVGKIMGALTKHPLLAAAGAATAIGGFAVSRGIEGFNTWQGGTQDRIKLRGLGIRQPLQDQQRAADLGMSSLAFRSAQIQSANTFGRANSTEKDVLGRAAFERNYGLDAGTLTNSGASLQSTMGSQGANESIMKLQASIMAAGLDDAIGPYLDQAVTLLASINENGQLNTTEIASLLAGFTKQGDIPQQVVKAFSTMQSAVTGSQGDANAFFQNAFARRGIGNGTIGGTQAAIESGGLFGVDPNSITGLGAGKNKILNSLNSLGITGEGTDAQNRAQGIIAQLKDTMGIRQDQRIEDADPQSLLTGGRMAKNLGLGRTALEGIQAMTRLQDVASGKMTSKEFNKEMERMQMSPELKNLEDIKKSAEGQWTALEAMHETIKDQLGNQLVPIATVIKSLLMNIDKGLAGALGLFGYNSEADAFKGVGSLKEGTKLSKEEQRSLTEEKARIENELSALESQKPGKAGFGLEKDPNKFKKDQLRQKLKNLEASMRNTGTMDSQFDQYRNAQVQEGARNIKAMMSGQSPTSSVMSTPNKSMDSAVKVLQSIDKKLDKSSSVSVKSTVVVNDPSTRTN